VAGVNDLEREIEPARKRLVQEQQIEAFGTQLAGALLERVQRGRRIRSR
jgi:hypothetical protein